MTSSCASTIEDLPSFSGTAGSTPASSSHGSALYRFLAGYRVDQGEQGRPYTLLGHTMQPRGLGDPILDKTGFEAGGTTGALVCRDRQHPAR